MSKNLAPKISETLISVKILKGPHAGEQFVFNKPKLAIGRGAENDLVLSKDPKISRQHLLLSLNSKGQLQATKVSSKNLMLVGSQPADATLLYRDIPITIGESEIMVVMDGLPLHPQSATLSPVIKNIPSPTLSNDGKSPPRSPPGAHRQSVRQQAPPAQRKLSGDNNIIVVLLVVFLVGGAFYIFNNKSPEVQKKVSDEAKEDLKKAALEATLKQLDAYRTDKKILEDGKQDELAVLSQAHFIKGRRDYTNGQYGRAIQAFRDALTFDPNHHLALKYLNLATRKQDEIVQYQMIYGRKYKDRGNFKLCRSAYQKVLDIKTNPDDKIHIEAKQMRDLCDTLTKGRY